ncbi:MAG: DNA mismatch repair endonuclease MutH [Pseudomonadota bacterium]
MMKLAPPQSEAELLQRVKNIAGKTLAQLAHSCNWPIPDNLEHNKGWIGQLIEQLLGTDAGNLSEPDFLQLGIELKTIPIKANGTPAETTYICVVPLSEHLGLQWQQSCVAKKLQRVLWVPIEVDKKLQLGQRKVGSGFIWSPNQQQQTALQEDWEELMEYVAMGNIESIDARYGEYLQIRPKAANSKARTMGVSSSGGYSPTLPRGFYLRTSFTKEIIKQYNK